MKIGQVGTQNRLDEATNRRKTLVEGEKEDSSNSKPGSNERLEKSPPRRTWLI